MPAIVLSLQIALFICIIIGIGLVIFSLIQFSISQKKEPQEHIEIGYALESIENSISKIDKTVDEFNRLSKLALQEIDDKYQELLFLFTLIEDKKIEVSNFDTTHTVSQTIKNSNKITNSKDRTIINNPKLTLITELENQGLSISEIAKQLDMGQGEVKLILELGRVR